MELTLLNQERMKNHRTRSLIERVASDPSIPDALTRDIVTLAQRHLQAAGRGLNPQHRDVTWAVSHAWRQWSRRFRTALEARSAQAGDASLNSAA